MPQTSAASNRDWAEAAENMNLTAYVFTEEMETEALSSPSGPVQEEDPDEALTVDEPMDKESE